MKRRVKGFGILTHDFNGRVEVNARDAHERVCTPVYDEELVFPQRLESHSENDHRNLTLRLLARLVGCDEEGHFTARDDDCGIGAIENDPSDGTSPERIRVEREARAKVVNHEVIAGSEARGLRPWGDAEFVPTVGPTQHPRLVHGSPLESVRRLCEPNLIRHARVFDVGEVRRGARFAVAEEQRGTAGVGRILAQQRACIPKQMG